NGKRCIAPSGSVGVCDKGECKEKVDLTASITSPKEGSLFQEREVILFKSKVYGGKQPYKYEWSSNLDNILSDSDSFTTDKLSPGKHTVTLKVTDALNSISLVDVHITVTMYGSPGDPDVCLKMCPKGYVSCDCKTEKEWCNYRCCFNPEDNGKRCIAPSGSVGVCDKGECK
ncbi:MAG: hypothetical protein QW802_05050, partial [Candidatus Altiarchaeota archaeon]